jgi:hypothetical protein
VHGVSDRMAASVTSDPVSPEYLLATLYHHPGLDPKSPIHELQEGLFLLGARKPVEGLVQGSRPIPVVALRAIEGAPTQVHPRPDPGSAALRPPSGSDLKSIPITI